MTVASGECDELASVVAWTLSHELKSMKPDLESSSTGRFETKACLTSFEIIGLLMW